MSFDYNHLKISFLNSLYIFKMHNNTTLYTYCAKYDTETILAKFDFLPAAQNLQSAY